MWDLGQDFVIRLTQKRKIFFHGKWVSATRLCAQRKGKVKLNLFYKGKEHEAYISHVKVQLTAAKRDVYLVLAYGITEHPMMLVTNKVDRHPGLVQAEKTKSKPAAFPITSLTLSDITQSGTTAPGSCALLCCCFTFWGAQQAISRKMACCLLRNPVLFDIARNARQIVVDNLFDFRYNNRA